MALDLGLGGGGSYIVPIDPILSGQQQYTPPLSSGRPTQTIPQTLPTYSSVPRVVQAYLQNILSYNEAYEILITQFGYSGLAATDVLGVESATVVAQQQLTPLIDTGLITEPEVVATSDAVVATADAAPTAPQDFALVGLAAVIGALWLFFGKG